MKKIFVLLGVLFLSACSSNNLSSDLVEAPPEIENNKQIVDIESISSNSEYSEKVSPYSYSEYGDTYQTLPYYDSGDLSAEHLDLPFEAPTGDIIEIRDKLFIAQTTDIYYNADDYLGKTIKYEGIFNIHEVPATDIKYYSVIRYGPGCCAIDGNAGFEVIWDEEYPNSNDWVEAIGVLEEYEEDGYIYLRLALTSLTVLPTRGEEYVFQ